MVLERLYHLDYLSRKEPVAFLMGLGYSLIGLVGAILLFPEDPALVAVAFCALLTLPTFYKVFILREVAEAKETGISIKKLWTDNKDVMKIYIFYFLGVFLTFSIFSMMLPSLAANHLFREQLGILTSSAGGAYFSTALFVDLMKNNLIILSFCLLTGLLFGDGALFLLIWNASVWGTIFGNLAKTAAASVGSNVTIYFLLILISVFPHMILEALSYILAAISGGVTSRGVIREIEDKFNASRLKEVILINAIVLALAVVVLVIAMLIETYVLGNFTTYRMIINQAFG